MEEQVSITTTSGLEFRVHGTHSEKFSDTVLYSSPSLEPLFFSFVKTILSTSSLIVVVVLFVFV
jgi:hypothetical protein